MVGGFAAASVLKSGQRDFANSSAFQAMHRELRHHRPGHLGLTVRSTDVISDLLEAVQNGVLVAYEDPPSPPPQYFIELEPTLPPEPPQPEIKSWIGVTLVEEDGTPFRNRRYTLVKPDSVEVEGRLDSKGSTLVQGLDSGDCKVKFDFAAPPPPVSPKPPAEPEPDPEPEPDSTPTIVSTRWEKSPVKCGDPVKLEAQTKDIPDDTEATFHVRSLSDGAEVATGTAKVGSDAATFTWESKKPSSDWPDGPELGFGVEAAGQSKDGDELAFHHYPALAKQERVHHRQPVGYATFDGRYSIEFTETRQVEIVVRVKLLNKQAARPASQADYGTVANGPPVSAADKATMKAAIEAKLSKRLDLHRGDCKRGDACDCPRANTCCRFEVVVRVKFVEADAHHTINLWPGTGRANAANWHIIESRPGLSWAHEVGHLLGWYDEYPGGGVAPAADNADGRWLNDRPTGIMGPGSLVFWDHLEDIRSWFVGRTHEQWRLVNR